MGFGCSLIQILSLVRVARAARLRFSDVAEDAHVAGHNRDWLFYMENDADILDDTALPPLKVMDSGHGGAWGDFNSDGYPDLIATGDEYRSHRLYLNLGNGTFEERTWMIILAGNFDDKMWNAYSAAWTGSAALRTPVISLRVGAFGYLLSNAAHDSIPPPDFDNDGMLDLYIADRTASTMSLRFDGTSKLFHNEGNGTWFSDVAEAVGVAAFARFSNLVVDNKGTRRSAIGVAWGDVDGDGFQDLFVLNSNNGANTLVHNVNGTFFTDVYSVLRENGEALILNPATRTPSPSPFTVVKKGNFGIGNANSAAFGDFDRDGDLDIFVSNHDSANELYRNDGNGRFTEVGAFAGVDDPRTGFGAAWADYDHDGYLDLYVGNHNGSSNVLYHNNGNGTFLDVTSFAGVGDTSSTYGVAWGDYDGDGLLDIMVANHEGCNPSCRHWGREETWEDDIDSSASQRRLFATQSMAAGTSHNRSSANKLFRNRGDGTFIDVAAAVGVDDARVDSFAATYVDFDLDGDLDLYVSNMHATNRLYRNDEPPTTTLFVRPLPPKGRALIPNAIVELHLDGVLVGLRMTDGGSGYRSQSLSPAHFAGLQAHTTYTVVTSIPGSHAMHSSHTTGEDGTVAWVNVRLNVRSAQWHSDSPSRSPTTALPTDSPITAPPTTTPVGASVARSTSPNSAMIFVLVALGVVAVFIGMVLLCRKRLQPRSALRRILLDEQHYELVRASEVEGGSRDFLDSYADLPAYVRSLQNSPAPSFVVDGNMRIVLWSDGMYYATGLAGGGMLLANLPYVTETIRSRTVNSVRAVLLSRHDENDHIAGAPLIFQIATSTRPCYLAMTASLLDCLVIVQGREQDPNLTQLAAPSLLSGSSFDINQDEKHAMDDALDPELTGHEDEEADRAVQRRISDLFAAGRRSNIASTISSLGEVMSDHESLSQGEGAGLGSPRGIEITTSQGASPPFLACAAPVVLCCLREDGVCVGSRLEVRESTAPRSRLPISMGDPRVTVREGIVLRAAQVSGTSALSSVSTSSSSSSGLSSLSSSSTYTFARVAGEGFLRVGSDSTVESCYLVGHDYWTKETDGVLLASGELEVDERGHLRRWIITPGQHEVDFEEGGYLDEHCVVLAGRSGLPFDRLWIRLQIEALPRWVPEDQLREIPLDVLDHFFDGADVFVEGARLTIPPATSRAIGPLIRELHSDPVRRPPIEVKGRMCLVKASAVDDGTLVQALEAVREYLAIKKRIGTAEVDAAVAHELTAARTRMHDLSALQTIRRASKERKVASKMLGFTSSAQQRAVVYERQYRKLRLILLALRDEDSPFGRGGLPVDLIISYLVPWRMSNSGTV